MTILRVSKFLSECGVASRRKAEELIEEGKIRVNGTVIKDLGHKIDPQRDRVQVRNQFVSPPEKGVILLNKPRGVVSTLSDPQGRRTVGDFLTKHYASYVPVGRLDYDSSGLLILTNDGELADRLMHPKYGFDRVYHVRVEGSVGERAIRKLEAGVTLDDGRVQGKARVLESDDSSTWLEIIVGEGKNRMVRRMMERVGHPVIKLKRVSHGPVVIGKLQPGQLRKLTEKEYRVLRAKIFRSEEAGRDRVPKRNFRRKRTRI